MRMRFILLCLFLTVSVLPAQVRLNYERFLLPNGLTVILHEDHSVPVVSVNVWYHVGSGNEKPGRTGFAHLFEHIMFEGSGHVPQGKFDEWLEAAGGDNNGSTTPDRTNYFEDIPNNALDLALFLESDRMGYLLDVMTPERVDQQRDVVKNERRQSYENRPYGMAGIVIDSLVYPSNHPYHWPTIGSMEDLTAASHADVVEFFKMYYTPSNASLVVAGDIDTASARRSVEKWFSDVPAGKPVPPVAPPAAYLNEEKRAVVQDNVQLPRLYMVWLSPPWLTPGDAELDILANVLTKGKTSRLYKRLVYDLQIAQDVTAFQESGGLSSKFMIVATARAGHTLEELRTVIDEEIARIKSETPSSREIERAVNQYEASFLDRLEGIGSKADQLNGYLVRTGNPSYFEEDLARYKAVAPADVRSIAQTFLNTQSRLLLSIVPEGRPELAVPHPEGGK